MDNCPCHELRGVFHVGRSGQKPDGQANICPWAHSHFLVHELEGWGEAAEINSELWKGEESRGGVKNILCNDKNGIRYRQTFPHLFVIGIAQLNLDASR